MNSTEFDIEKIIEKLDMKSYINKGLKFILFDKDKDVKHEFYHKNGIRDYIGKNIIFDPITFEKEMAVKIKKDQEIKINVEIVFAYKNDNIIDLKSFCNSIYTPEGGTHITGFKIALTSLIRKYIEDTKFLTKKDANLEISGDDIQSGIIGIINIKHPCPQYKGQTKDKLNSSEVQGVVIKLMNEEFSNWIETHSKEMKILCNKIVLSAKASLAAKKAKESITKKGETGLTILSDLSKLAPCLSKDISKNELFITEGNSAGGNAKSCREKQHQAIYALKGKIMNTNNSDATKILLNRELADLAYILTGKKDGIDTNFSIDDLKYQYINIMADADVDGLDIASHLITHFYKHYYSIVEEGRLRVCVPPLYSIVENGKKRYFLNQSDYNQYILDKALKKYKIMNGNTIINRKKALMNVLDKFEELKNYITELTQHNEELNLYLLDLTSQHIYNTLKDIELITSMKLSEISKNCNIKKYLKEISDVRFIKKENDLIFEGTADNVYVESSYKNFLKECVLLIKYRFEIELDFDYKLSNITTNEIEDLTINRYIKLYKELTPKSRSRFKGLGEMNPDELWETTMNPESRNMIQIIIQDKSESDEVMENLFNQKPKYSDKRKEFLLKHQDDFISEF